VTSIPDLAWMNGETRYGVPTLTYFFAVSGMLRATNSMRGERIGPELP